MTLIEKLEALRHKLLNDVPDPRDAAFARLIAKEIASALADNAKEGTAPPPPGEGGLREAAQDAERVPTCWAAPDAEYLHDDEDDAIDEIIDGIEGTLPETITIAGFARMEAHAGEILDDVLERLDEEYSNPDGDPTEPTEAMKEAERVFLKAIEMGYFVWSYEEVCRKEINVSEWLTALGRPAQTQGDDDPDPLCDMCNDTGEITVYETGGMAIGTSACPRGCKAPPPCMQVGPDVVGR